MNKINLSIYMINHTELIDSRFIKTAEVSKSRSLQLPEITKATLYIKRTNAKIPTSVKFFEKHVPNDIFGESISTGCALVLRNSSNVFVLTFGQGRHLIRQQYLVQDFGFRVVLNTVKANQIHSVDKASNGNTPLNSRNQSLDTSDLFELLFDPEQDIAASISGMSNTQYFGNTRISGRDAFNIATFTELKDIKSLLDRIYERYQAHAYKKHFSFIDNIKRIRQPNIIERLDDELAFRLDNKLELEKCWLAAPEIIDWERIEGFSFANRHNDPIYSVLKLDVLTDYLKLKNTAITINRLKKQNITTVDGSFHRVNSWSAYKCVYAEIKIDSGYYLLRNGVWYRIDDDFVARVNLACDRIPRYEVTLPEYDHDSEGAYNQCVSQSLSKSFCMDAKNIMYGGGRSRLEFCDVIVNRTDLLHVKRGTNSSSLSHLFSQGVVSAESFKVDESFRRRLMMKLASYADKDLFTVKPNDGQFRVVYGIVSEKEGVLDLPFFSKVTLKNACKKLDAMGFEVAIAKIDISKNMKATQKLRSQKKRKVA